MSVRDILKDKKRIVVKIGSSSLTHAETGSLNLEKMEKLVRILTMGITPNSLSFSKVFLAFALLTLSTMVYLVIRIWAMG